MTLSVPYLVFGYIYDEDGSTPLEGYTVTATDLTHAGSTTDTTDASGRYTIDLQAISACVDGDSIKISFEYDGDTIYETFTLHLSYGFTRLTLKVPTSLAITTFSGCTYSSQTTATITGKVTGGSGNVWFYWSANADPGETLSGWLASTSVGYYSTGSTFSRNITNLTFSTDYYYRGYITYSGRAEWSEDAHFQTPAYTAVEVTNVSGCVISGATDAVLSAKVTDGAGSLWFYYESGITGGGSVKDDWDSYVIVTDSATSGSYYTKKITGLNAYYLYSFRAYISSNGYEAGDDWYDTDTFRTRLTGICSKDLKIFYTLNSDQDYICCHCSGWNTDGYKVIFNTVITSDEMATLRSHIVPGAVTELYNILGTPTYWDTTWSDSNTIRVVPNDNSRSTLYNMREPKTIYVTELMTHPIPNGDIEIKIEGYISGTIL